jgi:hypothetical protein
VAYQQEQAKKFNNSCWISRKARKISKSLQHQEKAKELLHKSQVEGILEFNIENLTTAGVEWEGDQLQELVSIEEDEEETKERAEIEKFQEEEDDDDEEEEDDDDEEDTEDESDDEEDDDEEDEDEEEEEEEDEEEEDEEEEDEDEEKRERKREEKEKKEKEKKEREEKEREEKKQKEEQMKGLVEEFEKERPQYPLLFHPSTITKFQTPLLDIIKKRLQTPHIPSENLHPSFPLTSRYVETMFSHWKRMMNRNPDTKVNTMQALLLLSQFTYDQILYILNNTDPNSKEVTTFLNNLKSTERSSKALDKKAFDKLTAKTEKIKEHQKHEALVNILRTTYKISKPLTTKHSSLWTKEHSVEFYGKVGRKMKGGITNKTASELFAFVLETHHKLNPHLSNTLLPPSMPPQLTWNGDDDGQDDKEPEFTVERIVDNRKSNRKQEYLVEWKGSTEKSWEKENIFVGGSAITDYWKAKVEKRKKEIEEKRKEEQEGKEEEEQEQEQEEEEEQTVMRKTDDQEDGEGEATFVEFVVKKILKHKESPEGTQYLVEWKGGAQTWERGDTLDNDIFLASYWQTIYKTLLN